MELDEQAREAARESLEEFRASLTDEDVVIRLTRDEDGGCAVQVQFPAEWDLARCITVGALTPEDLPEHVTVALHTITFLKNGEV